MSGSGLVVKTHAFGDALLATPAVAALLAGGGDWCALAGPSSFEVWRRLPGLSSVIRAPFPFRGLRGALRLGCWAAGHCRRLRGFDCTVVFHALPAVRRMVRAATGAPSRSGGDSPLGPWETVAPMSAGGFAGSLYAAVAGVEVSDFRPLFRIEDSERRAVEGALPSLPCIAVAPGGGRNPRDEVAEKRWPAERFAALIGRAAASGLHVVLLGDSRDSCEASKAAALSGVASVTDLTGRTGWGEAAAVMERCVAFVGPDSGLAHLACAVGIPAVVLFGPTDPAALYAPGLVTSVVSGMPCAPCYSNNVFGGCRTGRGGCMLNIEPDMVWHGLEKTLDED